MMEVLDFNKVDGTQYQNAFFLVPHILPRKETSPPQFEVRTSAVMTVVGNGAQGNYFDSKNIVVNEAKSGSVELSRAESPQILFQIFGLGNILGPSSHTVTMF